MLQINFDQAEGIVIVTPSAPLDKKDFEHLAAKIDPYIKKEGKLKGLIIQIESFPGWENFAGLLAHLKFTGDHHRKIEKVAAVSDGKIISIMPRIVDHFVDAQVKYFPYQYLEDAISWVKS